MTNKEKAYQLYNELSHKCQSLHYGHTTEALIEMAEWKDKQFKEYLERKRDSLEMDYHKESYVGNAYNYDILNKIINELFGEEKL